MSFRPIRLRAAERGTLLVNDSGHFILGSDAFIGRFANDSLTDEERELLEKQGHFVDIDDPFSLTSHGYNVAERLDKAGSLDYLILVPTLRCNLSCSYCQVSRAGQNQRGFDWDEDILGHVFSILDALPDHRIKIEFQGGEPTLRPDLIQAVIERCERFSYRQFVICTNLQELTPQILDILDREDVYVSTSLDGTAKTHARNRTGDGTAKFLENLDYVQQRYGPDKISALPTIDSSNLPDIDELIDAYSERGLSSIFLRPINYQGFARKRHRDSREQDEAWRDFYRRFVLRIIGRNWSDRNQILEETYFSICLRRIFQPGADRHVDLRNPNPMGVDYVVIDYDGTVFPTDEARMLARSGVIDLSIGDVHAGWNSEKRKLLNAHSTNQFDPTCQQCAYQPFCGRDIIDDLARYGRINVDRTDTEFCRRHLHIFDFIFELIYSDDDAVRYSLARWLRLPQTPAILGRLVS